MGKTTLALAFVKGVLDFGGHVIYINSEPSSPVDRLEQLKGERFEEFANRITLLLPKSFDEQSTIVQDIEMYLKEDTRLVVMDTLTRLYRTVLEDRKTNYVVHRELNRQLGILKGLARYNDVGIIILNQVRAKMSESYAIEPVASSIMDYWSDYVLCIRDGKRVGERIVERLVPEGDTSREYLYLTAQGFSSEEPEEKQ